MCFSIKLHSENIEVKYSAFLSNLKLIIKHKKYSCFKLFFMTLVQNLGFYRILIISCTEF